MAKFQAKVSKSGTSKVITIPVPYRDDYEIGDRIEVTVERILTPTRIPSQNF